MRKTAWKRHQLGWLLGSCLTASGWLCWAGLTSVRKSQFVRRSPRLRLEILTHCRRPNPGAARGEPSDFKFTGFRMIAAWNLQTLWEIPSQYKVLFCLELGSWSARFRPGPFRRPQGALWKNSFTIFLASAQLHSRRHPTRRSRHCWNRAGSYHRRRARFRDRY